METAQVAIVRGEEELFARTAHLFAAATDVACAANDLNTWAASRPRPEIDAGVAEHRRAGVRVRKLYRPGVLLNPSTAQHLATLRAAGADIRITQRRGQRDDHPRPPGRHPGRRPDRRVAVVQRDLPAGGRAGRGVPVRGGLARLGRAGHVRRALAELRSLAPRVLELLAAGGKDESAARTLGLGVRTYRRRVAELMAALGAESRFQAGVRARELGLV